MKIVIDAANIDAGGAFKQLTAFAGFAAESGEEVELICTNSTAYATALCGQAVKITQPPILRRAQRCQASLRPMPRALAELAKLALIARWREKDLPRMLREGRVDLLFNPNGILPRHRSQGYAQAVMSQNMLPFDRSARRLFRSASDRTKLALIRRAQIRALRQADGIIFISAHALRTIPPQVPGLRGITTLNYLGADDGVFFPLPKSPEKSGELRIIYVSDLLPYKHHAEVLTAVAEVKRASRNAFRIDLVGGDWKGARRRLARQAAILGIADLVRFHGRLPQGQIATLLQDSEIGLFATSCENCPTTLIEKMKCGLAIACAETGPMPEILGNAGLYFDPRRSGEIARALVRLVDDPALRARLRAAAIVRAKEFRVDRHNTSLLAFLRQLGAKKTA